MKNFLNIFVLILLVSAVFVFFYINKPNDIEPVLNPPVAVKDSILGCYVATLSRDVYTLVIKSEADDGVVGGMIAYNNYEKDSSSGSFDGTFKDNILSGNYSFDSEGMHSDRQLIFKKVGDTFVQGFGPTKVIDGKETFENISTLNFDSNSTFAKDADCSIQFTGLNNSFNFNYNPYFKAYGGENASPKDWRLNAKENGNLLARVSIPRTYMPNTNFSSAYFTVGNSTNDKEVKNCTSDISNNEKKDGVKNIGGYTFTKFLIDDAGAGNIYNTTSYRALIEEKCYVLEYTIHSTNIDNYSGDQGVKEFDKNKIKNEFESIIDSFKFV